MKRVTTLLLGAAAAVAVLAGPAAADCHGYECPWNCQVLEKVFGRPICEC